MSLPPKSDLKPNTYAYESEALVTPNGFREYDARWLFVQEMGVAPRIVTGHDYRSYSLSIKQALMLGLMRAGCEVIDIGLATTPMAYLAQFELDVACVAMVTASHNENGWTGVKMGAKRPLTFGPDEMTRLKTIVLSGEGKPRAGGSLTHVSDFRERYLATVTKGHRLS